MKFLVYRQNWHPIADAEHCISAPIIPFESYELDEVLVTNERLMEMLTKSAINVLIKVSGTDHADKIRTPKEMEEDKDNLAKDYHYAVHIPLVEPAIPSTIGATPAATASTTTTAPTATATAVSKIEFPAVGIYKLVEVPGRVYGVWRTLIPTEKLTLCQIPDCKTDDIFDRQNGYRPSVNEHKNVNPGPKSSSSFVKSPIEPRSSSAPVAAAASSNAGPHMLMTLGMLENARSKLKSPSSRTIPTIPTDKRETAASAVGVTASQTTLTVSPLGPSLKFFNK